MCKADGKHRRQELLKVRFEGRFKLAASKQDILDYKRHVREVASLKEELEKLYYVQEQLREKTVHDSVQASAKDYPYQMSHVKIEGMVEGDNKDKIINRMIRDHIIKLNERQEMLAESLVRAAKHIEGIEDGTIKAIVTYRIINGDSWRVVARKIGGGNSEENVRQIFSRYLRTL